MTHVDEKGILDTMLGADIHFEDTQDIQVLQDKCLHASHLLDSDQVVMQNMQCILKKSTMQAVHPPSEGQNLLRNLSMEVNLEKKRIENVIQRLNATVALVRYIAEHMENLSEAFSRFAQSLTSSASPVCEPTAEW